MIFYEIPKVLWSFIYGLYHETSITRVKYDVVNVTKHLNNWAEFLGGVLNGLSFG